MSLHDFRRHEWDIEDEVRIILISRALRVKQVPDLSETYCREFVRRFVQTLYPEWQPGQALNWQQAQAVGAEWNRALWCAWRELPTRVKTKLQFVREEEFLLDD